MYMGSMNDPGPPPRKFWFVLDPLQASVIIAIISMLHSVVGLLFTGLLHNVRDTFESHYDVHSNSVDNVLGALLLICLVSLTCEVPLLLAALKHKRILMLPWLIKTAMGFIFWPAIGICLAALEVPLLGEVNTGTAVFFNLIIAVCFVETMHMWLVVKRSFSLMG